MRGIYERSVRGVCIMVWRVLLTMHMLTVPGIEDIYRRHDQRQRHGVQVQGIDRGSGRALLPLPESTHTPSSPTDHTRTLARRTRPPSLSTPMLFLLLSLSLTFVFFFVTPLTRPFSLSLSLSISVLGIFIVVSGSQSPHLFLFEQLLPSLRGDDDDNNDNDDDHDDEESVGKVCEVRVQGEGGKCERMCVGGVMMKVCDERVWGIMMIGWGSGPGPGQGCVLWWLRSPYVSPPAGPGRWRRHAGFASASP